MARKHFTAAAPPPSRNVECKDPSLARQSEKDSVDINMIMARYEKTGVLPIVNRDAFFADVSTVGDYREALARVQVADQAFMQVPAAVRERFNNDPATFLDFCSNPANRDEMVEMGLLEKPPAPPPAAEPAPPEGGKAS